MDPGLSQRSHFSPSPFSFVLPLFVFFSFFYRFRSACRFIGLSTSRLYHCFTSFRSVFIVKSFGMRLAVEGHRTFSLYYRSWKFSKSPREFCESNYGKGSEARERGTDTSRIFQGEMFRMLFAEGSARSRVSSNSQAYAKDSLYIDLRREEISFYVFRICILQHKRLRNKISLLCHSLSFLIFI